MTQLPDHTRHLWQLAVSPAIWAAHFLLSYVTAAVWCAKIGGSLTEVRTAIAVYTAVALAGIAFVGVRGFRQHRLGAEPLPHDFDSDEDRHRFIGFATLLLSVLSAIATIYTALAAVFNRTCI